MASAWETGLLQVHPLRGRVPDYYYYCGGKYKEACPKGISKSLRKNGFCLVQTHLGLISEEAMDIAEERRFGLSSVTKHLMSESNEEGYVSAGEHKEMFHFTCHSKAVQTPSYWYIPTAPGRCFATMVKNIGSPIFNGINAHVLKLLRRREEDVDQDAFVQGDDFMRWVNAVGESSQHLMTSFLYHESNPDTLHTSAHVDKGLLSICDNPNDLEVCVKGNWVSLGPQPKGVVAIMCGYTLERATGGLYQACRHRVRNNGKRRSRVMKIRLDPALVVHPSSVIAHVGQSLRDELPDDPPSFRINELMDSFAKIHTSVNLPNPSSVLDATATTTPSEISESDTKLSLGIFDMLPSVLLRQILMLLDFDDLSRLGCVCRSFRTVANSEELCVPVAERSQIDWGAALDRIDVGSPSHARDRLEDQQRMAVDDLLKSVSTKWACILGRESTDEKMRKDGRLRIRFRDQTGDVTYFRVRFGTRMVKMFAAYAQRKGVSIASLRFMLDGEDLECHRTPYELELEIGDQIDCMLDQRGD